jgi:molecular chaperone DnaK (HSP70)
LLFRQFEVLDVAWDSTLGSDALDVILLDHFAKDFESKHPGLDPRNSPKVGQLYDTAPYNSDPNFWFRKSGMCLKGLNPKP